MPGQDLSVKDPSGWIKKEIRAACVGVETTTSIVTL
jgi:hypothetical protein